MVLLCSAFKRLSNPTHSAFLGGYGARADRRIGGHLSTYVPRWTSCAAAAAQDAIAMVGLKYNLQGASAMMLIVMAPEAWKEYLNALLLTGVKASRELAASQMKHFHGEALRLGGTHMATAAGRRIRVLYAGIKRHTQGRTTMEPLVLPPPTRSVTLSDVMGAAGHPGQGLRPLEPGGRVEAGLAKWDWSHFEGTAYVCYERAHSRLVTDFPETFFKPGPDVVERLISRVWLPTALESAGDHYVVIWRHCAGPRTSVR